MPSLPELAPGASLPTNPEQLRAYTHQMVGRAQGIRMVTTFGRVAELSILREIKEQQLYEAEGHTWESFCGEVIGRSRRSIDEEIQNLDTFGQEFMEMADRMKIGRSTLRGLRQLPPEIRPRVLPSGEIVVEDRTIPLNPEHREEILEVFEDLVGAQDQLRQEMQIGRDQIDEAEGRINKLEKRIKEMEVLAKGRLNDVTPFEIEFTKARVSLLRVQKIVDDEHTAPAGVLKWARSVYPVLSELLRYGAEMSDDFALDPAEFDVDAIEETARELERMDRDA